jgi:hypothetical protein
MYRTSPPLFTLYLIMSSLRSTKPTRHCCTACYPSDVQCVRQAEQDSKWCRLVLSCVSCTNSTISPVFIARYSTHEEIEGKLLKLYKRHTTALESDLAFHKSIFLARSISLKTGITSRDGNINVSLEELRCWYADARNQWVLATRYVFKHSLDLHQSLISCLFRTLETRVRHHNAFYSGGDVGHLQYLDFLLSPTLSPYCSF